MSIASRVSTDLLSHGGTVCDRIGMLYILTNKRLTPVTESVPLSHANLFIVCPIEADDLVNNKYPSSLTSNRDTFLPNMYSKSNIISQMQRPEEWLLPNCGGPDWINWDQ